MKMNRYNIIKLLLLSLPVILVLNFIGVSMGIIPNQDAYTRTARYYENMAMREISMRLTSRYEEKKDYPPGKFYWGPLDENLAQEIGVDWGKMIDPLNRDGDSRNWREGPSADVDRGAWIRVRGLNYQYYTNGKDFWALVGRGPDGRLDLTTTVLRRVETLNFGNLAQSTVPFAPLLNETYDPTNGTMSHGDVWRVNR